MLLAVLIILAVLALGIGLFIPALKLLLLLAAILAVAAVVSFAVPRIRGRN